MAVERILVVDDEPFIRKSFEELLRGKRYSVTSAGTLQEAERFLTRDRFDLLFLDLRLPDGEGLELFHRLQQRPDRPVTVIISGSGTVETAIACLHAGASDYLIKPFSLNQVEVVVKKVESQQSMYRVSQRQRASARIWSEEWIGESEASQKVREVLRKIAPTRGTVLVCGASGSGKSSVARQIHRISERSQAPFLEVDCTQSPEQLEIELFGCEARAGVARSACKEGSLELADGGSLLLEEVGALSLGTQTKLLRFLQTQEFARCAGTKDPPSRGASTSHQSKGLG